MQLNKLRALIGRNLSKLAHYFQPAEIRGYKKVSYSRSGEDLVLREIFQSLGIAGSGFYVDVGANHPFRCSNTALFDELGWQGICVEPHPKMVSLLKYYRPKAKVIHAAVSSDCKNEIILHYIDGHPYQKPVFQKLKERLILKATSKQLK